MLTNKGFSLLEVLIGLVVLAIGILAIAGMQITAIKGNYFSGSLTQATILAQDKMEELKNTSYDSVTSGSDTKTIPPGGGTTFTRAWNVVNTTTTMKTITVTVTWTEAVGGVGINRNVSFSTIRAK